MPHQRLRGRGDGRVEASNVLLKLADDQVGAVAAEVPLGVGLLVSKIRPLPRSIGRKRRQPLPQVVERVDADRRRQ
jgi:hypothetical protein